MMRYILSYLCARYSETRNSIYFCPPWAQVNPEAAKEFQEALLEANAMNDKLIADMKKKIQQRTEFVFQDFLISISRCVFDWNAAIFQISFQTTFSNELVDLFFTMKGLGDDEFFKSYILQLLNVRFSVSYPSKEKLSFYHSLLEPHGIDASFFVDMFKPKLWYHGEPDSSRLAIYHNCSRLLLLNDPAFSIAKTFLEKTLPILKAFQYEQCERHMTYFQTIAQLEWTNLSQEEKRTVLLYKREHLFHNEIPFSREEQYGFYLGHSSNGFRNLLSLLYGEEVCPMMNALDEKIPPEVKEKIGYFIAVLRMFT